MADREHEHGHEHGHEHRQEARGRDEDRGDQKQSAHASDSGHEGTDGVKADWKQREQNR